VVHRAVQHLGRTLQRVMRDLRGLPGRQPPERVRDAAVKRAPFRLVEVPVEDLAEQRALVMEYEQYRDETARYIFEELSESARAALRKEKAELFKQQARYEKLETRVREQEIDDLICHDIARREVPPFEKWYIRRRAQQAVLPFGNEGTHAVAS